MDIDFLLPSVPRLPLFTAFHKIYGGTMFDQVPLAISEIKATKVGKHSFK